MSVGTGEQPAMPYDVSRLANAGWVDWAQSITDITFESQSWLAHYLTLVLLGQSYLRINPALKFPMALDDVSKLSQLKDISDIGATELAFIRKYLL